MDEVWKVQRKCKIKVQRSHQGGMHHVDLMILNKPDHMEINEVNLSSVSMEHYKHAILNQ